MRCYFHLRESGGYVVDEEGLDLPNLEAIREAAIAGARSIIGHEAAGGRLPLATVMEVHGEDGIPLFELRLRETVVLDG